MNNNYLAPRYPEWLGRMLLGHSLPWDNAQHTTMPDFLESYTLHDSNWIGLWSEGAIHECCVIVAWDTFWTNGRVNYPSSTVAEWPILAIHFTDVYHIFFGSTPRNAYMTTIANARSSIVSSERKIGMLDSLLKHWYLPDATSQYVFNETLYQTHIESIGGDDVDLLHGEEVRILCFTALGEPLSIPAI